MFELRSFLIGSGETTDSHNAWMVFIFFNGSQYRVLYFSEIIIFWAYSGILRDLVISLKCLLNISATLLSSDTMSFCSIGISFLACFTDLLEKKGPDSFPKVIFVYISCLHIIK